MLGHSRYLAMTLFLAAFGPALARRNITLNDSNPRIRYHPAVLPERVCRDRPDNDDCNSNWWTESNPLGGTTFKGTHNSFGPNTSLEVDFRGSRLYYYGITLDAGAHGLVSIDNSSVTSVSQLVGGRSPQGSQLIWTSPELNPNITHTFRLEFDNKTYGGNRDVRKWLSIDYLLITVGDDDPQQGDGVPPYVAQQFPVGTGRKPSAPSPAGTRMPLGTPMPSGRVATTDVPPSNDRSISTAALAGISAGITCAVILLVLLPCVCWLHRRRRRAIRVKSLAPPDPCPPPAYKGSARSSLAEGWQASPAPIQPRRSARATRFENFGTRRYSTMYQSEPSSLGLPVDERPPAPSTISNQSAYRAPLPPPPVPPATPQVIQPATARFKLHNPDARSHGTSSNASSS